MFDLTTPAKAFIESDDFLDKFPDLSDASKREVLSQLKDAYMKRTPERQTLVDLQAEIVRRDEARQVVENKLNDILKTKHRPLEWCLRQIERAAKLTD